MGQRCSSCGPSGRAPPPPGALSLSAEAESQPPSPAEAAPRRQRESRSRVDVLARHSLAHGGELCISAGSVLDFGGQTDWPPAAMAIVNAANCGGLGGGGVDGAITAAGGPELAAHRRALPILEGTRRDRIATGGAVLTGPGDYGRLFAANVIHAVGPNYLLLRGGPGQTLEDGDAELSEAYAQTMSAAAEAGIEYIGFSLLSAGIFRGPRSLAHVLQLGLEAVSEGAYAGLKEVHLVAFQPDEQQTLQNLLLQMKAAAEPEPEPKPEPDPGAETAVVTQQPEPEPEPVNVVESEQGALWQVRMGLVRKQVSTAARSCATALSSEAGRCCRQPRRPLAPIHVARRGDDNAPPQKLGEALCWEELLGRSCDCEGKRLHLPAGSCAAHVQYVLGQRARPCAKTSCGRRHLEREELLRLLLEWWGSDWSMLEPPTGVSLEVEPASQPASQPAPPQENSRAAPVCEPCAPPATKGLYSLDFWRREVASKYPDNPHLLALLDEPWMAALLAEPGAAKLWRGNRRRLLKELTESYAVLQLVRDGRRAHGGGAEDGRGVVVFDVCAGKGIASLMLSVALPEATVLLVDSNSEMDLSHLGARMAAGRLRVHTMDVFSAKMEALLRDAAQGAEWACAVGTHLCGALSPRLIALYGAVGAALDALVLSPCCLKGWLGKQVQRRAKAEGRQHYAVLVEELRTVLETTCPDDDVTERFDGSVLSEKNGYVLAARAGGRSGVRGH